MQSGRVLVSFLFLLLMFIPTLTYSAPGIQTWSKTLGGIDHDWANSVTQTSDSGFIVAGKSSSFTPSAGGGNAWIIKLTDSGKIDWQKAYDINSGEWANEIKKTSDGGYIVAGQWNNDNWVLKLNSDGTIAWQKAYGSNGREVAHSIDQTFDGGYILAGEYLPYGGTPAGCVIKIDSMGNIAWQKSIGSGYAHAIRKTSDNGYILLVGKSIIKIDSNGSILWQKIYNSGTLFSVEETTDNCYIVAGKIDGEFGISKFNNDGSIAWQKQYGYSYYADDGAYSVNIKSDGGFITTGIVAGYQRIYNLDQYGNIVWQKNYTPGSSGSPLYSISQTSDGGFISAGTYLQNYYNTDLWTIRIDETGDCGSLDSDTNETARDYYTEPMDGSEIAADLNLSSQDTNATVIVTNAK